MKCNIYIYMRKYFDNLNGYKVSSKTELHIKQKFPRHIMKKSIQTPFFCIKCCHLVVELYTITKWVISSVALNSWFSRMSYVIHGRKEVKSNFDWNWTIEYLSILFSANNGREDKHSLSHQNCQFLCLFLWLSEKRKKKKCYCPKEM